MRQAGEVTYADAHKERTNEGVIEFRSQSDMKRAIDKLDGTDINGRKIRLVPEQPRKQRSYSGSRSRWDSAHAVWYFRFFLLTMHPDSVFLLMCNTDILQMNWL